MPQGGVFIYVSSCFDVEGNMIGDIIAFFVDFFEVSRFDNGTGHVPCGINRNKRVISVNRHSEVGCRGRDHCTDCSETDNSESFACEFGARKVALSLFDELCNFVALTFKRLCPIYRVDNFS